MLAGLLLLIFLGSAVSYAEPRDYFGQTITEVRFDGLQTVDSSLVRRVAGIETGTVFNAGITQEAIRHLYALSLFSDIQIGAELTHPGLRITVFLTEYPRLRNVQWQGNKKVDEGDLKEKVILVANQIVSPDQIKQTEQAVLSLYHDRGYFAATVAADVDSVDDSHVDVVLHIDEGEKLKIKRVRVFGAKELSEGEIKGQMDNRADSWFRSGNYKPEKLPEDLQKIAAHYKKKGYLNGSVVRDTVFVNDSIGGLEIDIEVHEGRRFYFGQSSFEGNTLYTDRQMERALTYQPGDVFSEQKYNESVANLYSMLHEQGRLYGQVTDDRTTRDSVVDITFQITENEPAKVRYVQIEGNTKTKEKVIRRELSIFPGDTYRRSALERSIRDLMILNYFEEVVPDFNVLPNGDIDIVMKVKEKSTGQISVGGGYSAQDRFVGTIGFAVPNFLGNGQSLSINAERGSRRSSYDLSFTEPWFRDTRTSVGVDFFNLNRRSWDNNYDESRSGIGLRVGRRLRWPDRFTSVFLSGRIQDVGYRDFDSTYAANWDSTTVVGPNPDAKWPHRLSSLTFTLLRDSRDLAQFATRGSRISMSFEYAGDAVGGFWHYRKEVVDLQKYFPLYKQVALVFKARWGFVSPTYRDEYVPYSEEFQIGGTSGDGTLRGYEDGTGGVRISTGSRTPVRVRGDRPDDYHKYQVRATPTIQYDRARSMAVYNIELQFPIAPPQIYGLLFFDAGRGFASVAGWKPTSDLWRSAGIGARMVVPSIGTIGFDMGYGFDDDVVGGWHPHFQIGRGF